MGKGKPCPFVLLNELMRIRTTTTTVVSFTEQSVQIDVDATIGAVCFEDRKTGETLTVELTADQLISLAGAIRNVSMATWHAEDED